MRLTKEEKDTLIQMGVLSNLLAYSADFIAKPHPKGVKAYELLREILSANEMLADNFLNIFDAENKRIAFDDYCGSFDFHTNWMAKDFLDNLLYLCDYCTTKRMRAQMNIKVIRQALKACGAHVSGLHPERANKVIIEFNSINTFEYE